MVCKFYIRACDLNKWIAQNTAQNYEICDSLEGVLIDSFILYTKNGVAALYENYVSCWASNYRIEFGRDNNPDDIQTVWDRWEDFKTDYMKEWGDQL